MAHLVLLIAVSQSCQKPVSHVIWQERRFQRIPVALVKVLRIPSKRLMQLLVLLVQRNVHQGASISVHANGYSRPIVSVDGMIGIGVTAICLYVTGWTHFQMDLLLPQVFNQGGIFPTSYAVAEP